MVQGGRGARHHIREEDRHTRAREGHTLHDDNTGEVRRDRDHKGGRRGGVREKDGGTGVVDRGRRNAWIEGGEGILLLLRVRLFRVPPCCCCCCRDFPSCHCRCCLRHRVRRGAFRRGGDGEGPCSEVEGGGEGTCRDIRLLLVLALDLGTGLACFFELVIEPLFPLQLRYRIRDSFIYNT